MNISKRFIDRPIATAMLAVAIILLGAAAYPLLPVSAIPLIDFPTIQVGTVYPGADAQTIAATISAPLERQFAKVPGVTQMTSTNALGISQITLQFEVGRNLDGAAQDVQSAISAAGGQLPRDLPSPPHYQKVNPNEQAVLILAVSSKTLPLTEVDDAADTILAQQISQLPGVGQINIPGEQKPAIRIELNPDKLVAKGLGFEDVRAAVSSSTLDQPKGTVFDSHQTFNVAANDQLLKADAYNDIIIATNNGAPVRLRDVGIAIDGAETTQQGAWFNQQHGVVLGIQRLPGADIIATADRIKAVLPQLIRELPKGIDVNTVVDRTLTIRASIHEVRFTLMLTVALVVTVVFIFLRHLWGTVIPCIVVPVSIIGAFAVMYLLNYSVDNLSLMGLTIAVGFIVDDAIVVVENIERHIREGMSPYQAALKGSAEIGFTILSISISLMAVFIPLFLMSGYLGQLFREFAITVCAAVSISLIVSLTLTPMMSARLLSPEPASHSKLYMALERFFDAQLKFYRRSLTYVLRHQTATLFIAGLTLIATVGLFIALPKGFFPEQDTGALQGSFIGAPDVAFVDMVEKRRATVDLLLSDPAISTVASFFGGVGPLGNGQLRIGLKPRDQRDASAQEIVNRLRPKLNSIPGLQIYLQAPQDISIGARTSRTLYQYTLSDSDQGELDALMPKVMARLRTVPELADLTSDQDQLAPQLSLTINRDTASRFGVNPTDIDNTLNDAFGQRQIATIFTSINQYHVVMEMDSREPISPTALQRIYVKASKGNLVPLSELVSIERNTAPPTINHQGSFPAVTVAFNLSPHAALGDAVAAINQAMEDLRLPDTLHASFQGNAQAFQSSLSSEPILIATALITIYIVLAILYESLIHPLTILSTLPSAGVGALVILAIFRQDFTVMALIGVILLMGIVKKNGIMLVDFALAAERQSGLSPEEAIFEACIKRFRPIMMTTMAAMFSGLPLAIGFGAGAELRQPLGLTIVGGLLFSQAMTLYTTPVIYLALERLRLRLGGKSGRRKLPSGLESQLVAAGKFDGP